MPCLLYSCKTWSATWGNISSAGLSTPAPLPLPSFLCAVNKSGGREGGGQSPNLWSPFPSHLATLLLLMHSHQTWADHFTPSQFTSLTLYFPLPDDVSELTEGGKEASCGGPLHCHSFSSNGVSHASAPFATCQSVSDRPADRLPSAFLIWAHISCAHKGFCYSTNANHDKNSCLCFTLTLSCIPT